MGIGIAQQHVQGELLREVAEFFAICRSDQIAQPRPHRFLLGLLCQLFTQGHRRFQTLIILCQTPL